MNEKPCAANQNGSRVDKIDRRRRRMSLPVEEWPQADRLVWNRAKRADGLFDRAAPLAGLAADTIRGREQSLGRFLSFAVASGFEPTGSLTEIASKELINAYINHLHERLKAGSVYEEACRLQASLGILASKGDFGWIRQLSAIPAPIAVRRSRKPVSRPDAVLVLDRALQAFDAAAGKERTNEVAQWVRNNLMMSFVVLFSLRLKNLTEIKLGEHLIHNGGGWRLTFSKTLKTDSALLFNIPKFLEPRLQIYLDHHRQILLGKRPKRDELWLARGGKPLSNIWASKIIDEFGRQHLGRGLHSHLFRHEFASRQLLAEPDSADLCAAALGHKNSKMTNEVYTHSAAYEMTGLWLKKVKGLRRA